MQLSEYLKHYLVSELTNVASNMGKEESDPEAASFWYSGAFGAVQRVLNLEYQEELTLLHLVLQISHSHISNPQSRASRIQINGQSVHAHLASLLEQLSSAIANGTEYNNLLVSIATAGYLSTGNGYYLWSSGRT